MTFGFYNFYCRNEFDMFFLNSKMILAFLKLLISNIHKIEFLFYCLNENYCFELGIYFRIRTSTPIKHVHQTTFQIP